MTEAGRDEAPVGILAFGAYVPRLRLQRAVVAEANAWLSPSLRAYAKGERAMCNWDEDSLTMAVEAARDCLADGRAGDVREVVLASTTLPYLDRQNAGVVAAALDLGAEIGTMDVTGSLRAGTTALASALRAARAPDGAALVVASDRRRAKAAGPQEMLYGDGAAALAVGAGEQVAAALVAARRCAVDFVDHFRRSEDAFDYYWEERWIRDEGYLRIVAPAVRGLLEEAGVAPGDIAHFVVPVAMRGVGARIARAAGIGEAAVRGNLQDELGDTGAAHSLIMLCHALEEAEPAQHVLVVGWGQGCDVLLFRTTERLREARPRLGVAGHLARRRPESSYTRYLAFNDLLTVERGIRSEFTPHTAPSAIHRNRDLLLGLKGGKCRVCGTVQIPRSNACVNPNCGAMHSQDDYRFADLPARLQSWTADSLTYTPDPPMYFGMVVFEEGGRLMADLTDVDAGALDVGARVRMVFRVKHQDRRRGFTHYFWKAAPEPEPG